MIHKSSFSCRRNKFRSNLTFHSWAYPNPNGNVACELCPQPENLDLGLSSHLPQNCLEPGARPVRRGLGSQTTDLWTQEIRDRLEKRITTGPVVPMQETMLSSPISTIDNEFVVILNKKFKEVQSYHRGNKPKVKVVEITLETTFETADFVAEMDLDYFSNFHDNNWAQV